MNAELPVGVYEQLVTAGLMRRLDALADRSLRADRGHLDEADAPAMLARHVARVVEQALASTDPSRRVDLVNDLLHRLANLVGPQAVAGVGLEDEAVQAGERPVLLAVQPVMTGPGRPVRPHPEIGLSRSDLLVHARGEPSLQHNLLTEIGSADRIDLIVSFIRHTGLRLLLPALVAARDRGVSIRVLTTTYLGASEQRAIDDLIRIGAEVRISFDGRLTRLHAKGWLFERDTGFSTAYVGSSNLSQAAMVDGQEWNVRLSRAQTPELIDKFRATFQAYWTSPDHGFEAYDPAQDSQIEQHLREALARARVRPGVDADTDAHSDEDSELSPLRVYPYPFQQEMLDDLDRERAVYGRSRNLVVSATGTGKTVIAAFDYERLWRQWGKGSYPSLLFVAHRAEILRQSRRTFRHVLNRGDFGELLVDGERPEGHRHVFASIQSLSPARLAAMSPDAYDVVIVDEFHHAQAATYQRLLEHVRPQVLLGLTATPERMDGRDVLAWFDGHVATELRLWDALERGLLTPFHYFGVGHEDLDFRKATWSGGYRTVDLDRVVTGNDVLIGWVIQQVRDKVADPRRMRALAFASTVAHAHFVAQSFTAAGIRAIALDASTPSGARRDAVQALRDGDVQALVTVDLFNEGVDVPEVDTVLLLRPTESATVFLQQLGRGLRRAHDKSVLTVLDFIGFQHAQFRFDLRFRALTGVSRQQLARSVEQGFAYLPAGTAITLDRVAQEAVLENVRRNVPTTTKALVDDVRRHAALRGDESPYRLQAYLADALAEPADVYPRSRTDLSWTSVLRQAGLRTAAVSKEGATEEGALLRRVRALAHVDDLPRLNAYHRFLTAPHAVDDPALPLLERRLAAMLYFTLWPNGRDASYGQGLARLAQQPAVVDELMQLWEVARERIPHRSWPLTEGRLTDVPLRVHARYTREEMLAGLGWAYLDGGRPRVPRGQAAGVRELPNLNADAFDVTWRKTEGAYSPTTMYRDYAISPRLIHWESPSAQRADAAVTHRYVEHEERGRHILLFARESKHGPIGTQPLMFLGTARYRSHEGERPVSFVWELDRALPAEFYLASQVLTG